MIEHVQVEVSTLMKWSHGVFEYAVGSAIVSHGSAIAIPFSFRIIEDRTNGSSRVTMILGHRPGLAWNQVAPVGEMEERLVDAVAAMDNAGLVSSVTNGRFAEPERSGSALGLEDRVSRLERLVELLK